MPPVEALITFTADEGWVYQLFSKEHFIDWTSDFELRFTRIMPSWKNGTICRSGSHEKNTCTVAANQCWPSSQIG